MEAAEFSRIVRASIASLVVGSVAFGLEPNSGDAPRVRELLKPLLSGGVVYPEHRVIKISFDGAWATEEVGHVEYTALAPHSFTIDLKSIEADYDVDRVTYHVRAGAKVFCKLQEPVVVIEGSMIEGSMYEDSASVAPLYVRGSHGGSPQIDGSACGKIYAPEGWSELSTSGACWAPTGIGGGCLTKSCSLQGDSNGTVVTPGGNDSIDGECGSTTSSICGGTLAVDC